jgi:hypothetical protein
MGKNTPVEKIYITFNSKFYKKEAIEAALKDFIEVCEGKILNNKIDVELTPKQEIKEPLKEEFCNYVLGMMKNKGLV